MRTVLTSLLALVASGLAGGIVSQQLAVWSNAGEEFIAVFFLDMLVVLGATLALFVAQFFSPRAVSLTAAGLAVLILILLGALWVWAASQSGSPASFRTDTVLFGSTALSALVIVVAHWLVVRWRMG